MSFPKHSEIITVCSCFTLWCSIELYAICVCIHKEMRPLNFEIWFVSMLPQLRKSLCCRPLQPRTCSSSHIQRWCHGEWPHFFHSDLSTWLFLLPDRFQVIPHSRFLFLCSFWALLFFPPFPPAWIWALVTSPHFNLIEFVSCANGTWNATLILPVNVINVLISWQCSAC